MSRENRQVGEAVAWRFNVLNTIVGLDRDRLSFDAPSCGIGELIRGRPTALIPASDLEQVSRERDGLEDALRGIVEVCGWTTNDAGEWTPSPDYPGDIAKTALNNLDNRND